MSTTEDSLRREIDRLRKDVKRLEGDLGWYGREDHYDPMTAPVVIAEGRRTYTTMACPVLLDRGKRARKALERKSEAGEC